MRSSALVITAFLAAALLVAGCSPQSSTTQAGSTQVQPPAAPSAPTTMIYTNASNPHATITTSMGTIVLELYQDKTPLTVANFIKLAQSGFYDGVAFHRVIPGFMIQGGDPLSKNYSDPAIGTGGPGYTIPDEIDSSLHNVKGVISMANTGRPNTGSSQFFITTADDTFLDGGYTVFGRVISGQDVADAISQVPRDANDKPLTAVVISNVTIS